MLTNVKKSQNIKKSKQILKNNFFFQTFKIFKIYFFPEKNAFLLVLPFKKISLRPELSSPPHFQIQGG